MHSKALNANDKQKVKLPHGASARPKFCHFFKSANLTDNDNERRSTLEHMGIQIKKLMSNARATNKPEGRATDDRRSISSQWF